MKPTDEQIESMVTAYSAAGSFSHRECLRAVISKWESIRPKDPQELPEWIPVGEQLPTRNDADEVGDIACMNHRGEIDLLNWKNVEGFPLYWLPLSTLAALPKRQPAPKPLEFPEPPQGREWWNPDNLTPEQVGIADGWRLLCTNEPIGPISAQLLGPFGDRWGATANGVGWVASAHNASTYRTKAPLPAPKPTVEEVEEQEMQSAFRAWGGLGDSHSFYGGWKAARATKGGAA